MNEIKQYERIQEYLLGRMSDEDRVAFERELDKDDTLIEQREYYMPDEDCASFNRELDKDDNLIEQCENISMLASSILKANQKLDLQMALEEIEKQVSESSAPIKDEAEMEAEFQQIDQELRKMGVSFEELKPDTGQIQTNRTKRLFKAIEQWVIPTENSSSKPTRGNQASFSLSYVSRMAISFAVAASIALAIVLPYNATRASSGFNYAPSRLEPQTFRGSSYDILENAVNSYNNNDYGAALYYLEEAQNDLEANISRLGDNDFDIIIKQSLMDELYQVEWYRALTLMKDKKVKEAKRSLRDISESNSPYANEASLALEQVY